MAQSMLQHLVSTLGCCLFIVSILHIFPHTIFHTLHHISHFTNYHSILFVDLYFRSAHSWTRRPKLRVAQATRCLALYEGLLSYFTREDSGSPIRSTLHLLCSPTRHKRLWIFYKFRYRRDLLLQTLSRRHPSWAHSYVGLQNSNFAWYPPTVRCVCRVEWEHRLFAVHSAHSLWRDFEWSQRSPHMRQSGCRSRSRWEARDTWRTSRQFPTHASRPTRLRA